MTDEQITNQTQFSQEEPLFQAPVPETIRDQSHETATLQPTNPRKKIIIIAAAAFGMFMLLLLLFLLLRPSPEAPVVLEALPSPSPTIAVSNPLRERVKNLQSELDTSDPSNQVLVFPPIKMDLSLD